MHLDLCSGGMDRTELVGGEFDGRGADVLLQAMELARAGDRHNPRLLRQHPGQRDLRWRRMLLSSDLGEQVGDRLVGFERIRCKAREPASNVGATKAHVGVNLPGQEALPERAPRNEADPKLFAGWQ